MHMLHGQDDDDELDDLINPIERESMWCVLCECVYVCLYVCIYMYAYVHTSLYMIQPYPCGFALKSNLCKFA